MFNDVFCIFGREIIGNGVKFNFLIADCKYGQNYCGLCSLVTPFICKDHFPSNIKQLNVSTISKPAITISFVNRDSVKLCGNLSIQKESASSPNSLGILVYKLVTSNVTKVLSIDFGSISKKWNESFT